MKRWLAPAAVLALLAAGVGWYMRDAALAPPAAVATAPAVSPVLPAAPPPVPPAASGTPATARAAASAPLPMDLCGLGRMPVPAGAAATDRLPTPIGDDSLQAWLPAWKARLAAGDARSRAAGLLFAPDQPGGDVAALVQLARTARDPVVWAWAFGACAGQHADPACSRLDAAEWARDDPGNAWPWLVLGETDPRRRREALAEAARGSRVQTYAGQLAAQVLRAAPPDMPRYLRRQPLLDAMGAEAGFDAPALAWLADGCGAQPAACQPAAELLAGYADTWRGVGLGIALGERLGWPAARVAALKDERQRGEQVTAMPALTLHAQPHGCDALDGAERFVADVAALGEVGSARQPRR